MNWEFWGEHYFLSFFAICSIYYLLRCPFWLMNRMFRCINIAKRGWPPEHIDADGDFRPKE